MWMNNLVVKAPHLYNVHTRNVEMPNGIRIKYCRDCNIYFHRDTMAAQNQAIRKRSELFDGSIPIQFQRPSVSDTVPAPIIGTGSAGRKKNSNGGNLAEKEREKSRPVLLMMKLI